MANTGNDLRYAFEDDFDELFEFVNFLHQCEYDSKSPCFFRKEGDRVDGDVLKRDLGANRWIVLEGPRPDENIIAALRIKITKREGDMSLGGVDNITTVAVIDVLCGVSESVTLELLFLAEKIGYNNGASVMIVELPQCREDIGEAICQRGYENKAGRMWADDTAPGVTVSRATMVFEYHKVHLQPPVAQIRTEYTFEDISPVAFTPSTPNPISAAATAPAAVSTSSSTRATGSDPTYEADGKGGGAPAQVACIDNQEDIGRSVFADYDDDDEEGGDDEDGGEIGAFSLEEGEFTLETLSAEEFSLCTGLSLSAGMAAFTSASGPGVTAEEATEDKYLQPEVDIGEGASLSAADAGVGEDMQGLMTSLFAALHRESDANAGNVGSGEGIAYAGMPPAAKAQETVVETSVNPPVPPEFEIVGAGSEDASSASASADPNRPGPAMESLMLDLFVALHKEYDNSEDKTSE